MDKIFHSTFDFFSHAIPGACICVSFNLLDKDLNSFQDFLKLADSLNIGAGILLLTFGYIIGFAIYPLGRTLNKRVGLKIWKKQIHENIDMFVSEKFILIRELSPNNFKYIETWNMFCAMSFNLAIAALVVFFITLSKIILLNPGNYGYWIAFLIGLAILFFLFLHRAAVFYTWAADDLNAAIKKLRLDERAARLPEEN